MARFYVDGIEIDVSEPLFHLPIEKVDAIIETLLEYKNDNNKSTMAQI